MAPARKLPPKWPEARRCDRPQTFLKTRGTRVSPGYGLAAGNPAKKVEYGSRCVRGGPNVGGGHVEIFQTDGNPRARGAHVPEAVRGSGCEPVPLQRRAFSHPGLPRAGNPDPRRREDDGRQRLSRGHDGTGGHDRARPGDRRDVRAGYYTQTDGQRSTTTRSRTCSWRTSSWRCPRTTGPASIA